MGVTYHEGEYLVLCRQRRRRTWTQPGVREGSLELVTEGEEALTSWRRRTLWAGGVAYLIDFGVRQGAQCFSGSLILHSPRSAQELKVLQLRDSLKEWTFGTNGQLQLMTNRRGQRFNPFKKIIYSCRYTYIQPGTLNCCVTFPSVCLTYLFPQGWTTGCLQLPTVKKCSDEHLCVVADGPV